MRGNADEWALIERLPETAVVEAEGRRIGIVHDAGPVAGRHRRLRARFPGCDVVVYAHTHLPELVEVDGAWLVNPGSPTERRRGPRHTMAIVRAGVPELVQLEEGKPS